VSAGGGGDLDTFTMARIYLDQGRVEEATAIYDRLIAGACGDADQIAALRATVAQSLAAAADARRHAAEVPTALPETHDRDLVALAPRRPGAVLCVWEATPRGQAAAAAQLAGRPGRLVLRTVTRVPGAAAAVSRDFPLDSAVGEVDLAVPTTGGFLCAAVGLLARDGTFAPLAHADVLRLAGGAEATAAAIRELEVEPARGGPDHEPPLPQEVTR
jgi:hypothetical protein